MGRKNQPYCRSPVYTNEVLSLDLTLWIPSEFQVPLRLCIAHMKQALPTVVETNIISCYFAKLCSASADISGYPSLHLLATILPDKPIQHSLQIHDILYTPRTRTPQIIFYQSLQMPSFCTWLVNCFNFIHFQMASCFPQCFYI